MHTIHSLLIDAHIAIGSIALILFWVPVFAKKGSRVHVKFGKVYVSAMYAVVVTAFVASVLVLIDPIAAEPPGRDLDIEASQRFRERARNFSLFLLMLSVLVFTSLRHGILALRARVDSDALSRPVHRATIGLLLLLGVGVGLIGIRAGLILLMVFSGISIAGAIGMFRDTRANMRKRNERIAAHLNALIGTGIGAYTAFFAFGGSRFFAELLPGQWQVIPWVLPSVIGTIAIRRLVKRYQPTRTA